MTTPPNPPCEAIVLFDGVCELCNRTVDFVVRHDKRQRVCFAPLQSEVGQKLMAEHGLPTEQCGSVVLIEGGRSYTESTAALRLARLLEFPWSLMHTLIVLPPPLRDAAYRYVARHRYRWFGRRETCRVPTPSERARFLS